MPEDLSSILFPFNAIFRAILYGFINTFAVITTKLTDFEITGHIVESENIRCHRYTDPASRAGPEIYARPLNPSG